MATTTFHHFPRLPIELQDEIWEWHTILTYSEPQRATKPEVCILAPLLFERPPRAGVDDSPAPIYTKYPPTGGEEVHRLANLLDHEVKINPTHPYTPMTFPFTVDLPYPALLHTCHSSRAFLLRTCFSDPEQQKQQQQQHWHEQKRKRKQENKNPKRQYFQPPEKFPNLPRRLRYSPQADLQVPFREFQPEIDTLYWTSAQFQFFRQMFSLSYGEPISYNYDYRNFLWWTRTIRHLAVEATVAFSAWAKPAYSSDPDMLGIQLHRYMSSLETLSLVFPSSEDQSYRHPGSSVPWWGDGGWYSMGLGFVPPGRRCRLRKLGTATTTITRSYNSSSSSSREGDFDMRGIRLTNLPSPIMDTCSAMWTRLERESEDYDNARGQRQQQQQRQGGNASGSSSDINSSKQSEDRKELRKQNTLCLDEFLDVWRASLVEEDEAVMSLFGRGAIHYMEVGAAVFEEWVGGGRHADDDDDGEEGDGNGRPRGRWVEVCKNRKLGNKVWGGGQVRYLSAKKRAIKDPLKYRVLDDDCGKFGKIKNHVN